MIYGFCKQKEMLLLKLILMHLCYTSNVLCNFATKTRFWLKLTPVQRPFRAIRPIGPRLFRFSWPLPEVNQTPVHCKTTNAELAHRTSNKKPTKRNRMHPVDCSIHTVIALDSAGIYLDSGNSNRNEIA